MRRLPSKAAFLILLDTSSLSQSMMSRSCLQCYRPHQQRTYLLHRSSSTATTRLGARKKKEKQKQRQQNNTDPFSSSSSSSTTTTAPAALDGGSDEYSPSASSSPLHNKYFVTVADPSADASSNYYTTEDTDHEVLIKKSRFIAYLQPSCYSYQEAKDFVLYLKTMHPKARHVCSAWRGLVAAASQNDERSSNNDDDEQQLSTTMTPPPMMISERYDDDGEPTGTGGQPILNVLQRLKVNITNQPVVDVEPGIVNIVCAVVRYYGGTKLGAGGLVRSYGQSARQMFGNNVDGNGNIIDGNDNDNDNDNNLKDCNVVKFRIVVPTTPVHLSNIQPSQIGVIFDVLASIDDGGGGNSSSNSSPSSSPSSLATSVLLEYDEYGIAQTTEPIMVPTDVVVKLKVKLKDLTKGTVTLSTGGLQQPP